MALQELSNGDGERIILIWHIKNNFFLDMSISEALTVSYRLYIYQHEIGAMQRYTNLINYKRKWNPQVRTHPVEKQQWQTSFSLLPCLETYSSKPDFRWSIFGADEGKELDASCSI